MGLPVEQVRDYEDRPRTGLTGNSIGEEEDSHLGDFIGSDVPAPLKPLPSIF